MNHTSDKLAAIVLCGGKSSRMGTAKADLPFGEERLLQRMIRIVRDVAGTIVVVRAEGQSIDVPDDVLVTTDSVAGQGPLQGIWDGLAVLNASEHQAEAAFVTSCDVPFLQASLIRHLYERMENNCDVVVPQQNQFFHPLCAIYRSSVGEAIESLLDAGVRRPASLFDNVETTKVPVEELRDADPDLRSLMNLNHPEDYQAALDLLEAEQRRS